MHVITLFDANGAVQSEQRFVDRDRAYRAYDTEVATPAVDRDGWEVTMADDGKVNRRHRFTATPVTEPDEVDDAEEPTPAPAAGDLRERVGSEPTDRDGRTSVFNPTVDRKAKPKR